MADDEHPDGGGPPTDKPPPTTFELKWHAPQPPESEDDDEFNVWIAGQTKSHNHMGLTGATIRKGPQVCKTVSFGQYGDGAEVSSRKLQMKTSPRKPGGGYDFSQASQSWYCENEEIEKLLAFLKSDVDQPGRYRIIDATSPAADVVALLESSSPDELAAVTKLLDGGTLATALSQSAAGVGAAEGAVLLGRRQLLARLKTLVADPTTTESKVRPLVENEAWLFGGRYVGVLSRRELLPLDQHDIPLVTADGCLHIIELKGPNIPKLIHKYRNHWIAGTDVHEATMQAVNYIRSADEFGLAITTNVRDELGIEVDLRRTFATVVIGHRAHVPDDVRDAVSLALRTYNATLSRVQVVTYDDLLDAAERALTFTV